MASGDWEEADRVSARRSARHRQLPAPPAHHRAELEIGRGEFGAARAHLEAARPTCAGPPRRPLTRVRRRARPVGAPLARRRRGRRRRLGARPLRGGPEIRVWLCARPAGAGRAGRDRPRPPRRRRRRRRSTARAPGSPAPPRRGRRRSITPGPRLARPRRGRARARRATACRPWAAPPTLGAGGRPPDRRVLPLARGRGAGGRRRLAGRGRRAAAAAYAVAHERRPSHCCASWTCWPSGRGSTRPAARRRATAVEQLLGLTRGRPRCWSS